MKCKNFMRLFPLLLVVIMSIPGVFAFWNYAVGAPAPVEAQLSVELAPFAYEPSQILPTTPPENHQAVVDAVLNDSGGLNASFLTNWFIPTNLMKYGGVLYSKQAITFLDYPFQNLLEVFISQESSGLYFIIQELSEKEIVLFTASQTEIDSSQEGDMVVVYRTLLQKGSNGDWEATESQKGYVALKPITVDQTPPFLSFDPRLDEWHPGNIPTQ